jgi:hypothetical protein
MQDHDFRIEFFVFPDGTEIEMLVFEKPTERTRTLGEDGEERHDVPARHEEPARHTAQQIVPEAASAVTESAVAEPAADQEEPPPDGREYHVCPLCHGELVYPIVWFRANDTAWQLRMRCPECETERDVIAGRADVEDLNRRLSRGSQELAKAADEMSRRNFEEEAAKLVAALELDLILPMDF